MKIKDFSQPKLWQKITKESWVFCIFLSTLLFVVGVYWVFQNTPNDYQQGVVFKIFYIHVPTAWLSLGLYAATAFLGFVYIVFRSPVSAIIARSTAWVGFLLTVICLITGALWGKSTWGTYWVWDARLTSMSLLAFLYIGYLIIGRAFTRLDLGWKMSSVVALFGSINLPIIKWSVEWWYTLHQPPTLSKLGAPSIHASMVPALIFMFLGFLFYTLSLVSLIYQTQIIRIKKYAQIKKGHDG